MLVILNKELVMVEALAWARGRVAEVLRVSAGHVRAEWRRNSLNQLAPKFELNEVACPEVDPKVLHKVFQGVSREMRLMIEERLEGLRSRRRGSPHVRSEQPGEVCDPRHRLVAQASGTPSEGGSVD